MIDITSVGEILIDFTQVGFNESGIPLFAANPGGAPANLAVAASKLGATTAFIGKVGTDNFGSLLQDTLNKNNVDTKGLVMDNFNRTTLAVVALDQFGERTFSFYRNPSADVNLTMNEISEEQLKHTHFLHFGSVSLTTEPSRSATLYAVKTAKKYGSLISYDPNYRANLWSDEKTAIEKIIEPLSMVDILKISDEELPLLTGTDNLEEGSAILATKGIPLILITLGAKGSFYCFHNQVGYVSGVPCKVADTNGAGDTFFGATLAQLSKFYKLDDITIADLEKIIAISNKAASLTTSRHGAIPAMPTYNEVFLN